MKRAVTSARSAFAATLNRVSRHATALPDPMGQRPCTCGVPDDAFQTERGRAVHHPVDLRKLRN